MPPTDFTAFAAGKPAPAALGPSAGLPPTPGGWLTPGEVAREAGVAPRTVSNWCDRGLLLCERLPSGHRRIPARAWELFRAGASPAEQEAALSTRERQEDLARRIREASSPQEVMDLLRGER